MSTWAENETSRTRKVEIEAKIQHLREWLKGEVDIDAEEGDPDLFEREKHLALLTTLERRLDQTETALRAIDKGCTGFVNVAANRSTQNGWKSNPMRRCACPVSRR